MSKRNTNRSLLLLAGLVTAVAASAGQANATVLQAGQSYFYTPTGPGEGYDNGGTTFDLGSGFDVTTPITVNALGAYEAGDPAGTLNATSPGDTYATLFQATDPANPAGGGTLVASVEIPVGTPTEDSGFSFAALTSPVVLSPGLYFVTALADYNDGSGTSSSYLRYASSSYTVGSGISLYDPSGGPAVFNFSSSAPGSYPNYFGGGDLTAGGNLIYSVPEPASASLIVLTLPLLLRRRRNTPEPLTILGSR